MTDCELISDHLQKEVRYLAEAYHFTALGFVALSDVTEAKQAEYDAWLNEGKHADMHFLTQNREVRFAPERLLEGARSAIIVAISYFPERLQAPDAPKIAKYAYGIDYHKVLKRVLASFATEINDHIAPHQFRVIVDTAPFLERYWAEQSGIGFIGKNQNLIIPEVGSFFFLGEILTTLPLQAELPPMRQHCATCSRCVDACPTHALDHQGGLDARKCVSYLTIEHRGEVPQEVAHLFGQRLYGCDTCQDVCPFNRRPIATHYFPAPSRLYELSPDHLEGFDEETYAYFFHGTAATRAKFVGMKRNADIYLRNNPTPTD